MKLLFIVCVLGQVIILATIALAVASLCTVAVPKLSGELIDICIKFGQGSFTEAAAKHRLNGEQIDACIPLGP